MCSIEQVASKLEGEAGAVANALIGDAKGEDFPQGHFVDVIRGGTGGWGMIGCLDSATPGFGGPAYRLGKSRKLLNFGFVAGYGGGSFGDYVVITGMDGDSATWVLIEVGALAGALAAAEVIRLVDEEG